MSAKKPSPPTRPGVASYRFNFTPDQVVCFYDDIDGFKAEVVRANTDESRSIYDKIVKGPAANRTKNLAAYAERRLAAAKKKDASAMASFVMTPRELTQVVQTSKALSAWYNNEVPSSLKIKIATAIETGSSHTKTPSETMALRR